MGQIVLPAAGLAGGSRPARPPAGGRGPDSHGPGRRRAGRGCRSGPVTARSACHATPSRCWAASSVSRSGRPRSGRGVSPRRRGPVRPVRLVAGRRVDQFSHEGGARRPERRRDAGLCHATPRRHVAGRRRAATARRFLAVPRCGCSRSNCRRQAGLVIFRPNRAEKCACPPSGRRGQSHFRGLRRENRDSPRERLRDTWRAHHGSDLSTTRAGASLGPAGRAVAGTCRSGKSPACGLFPSSRSWRGHRRRLAKTLAAGSSPPACWESPP